MIDGASTDTRISRIDLAATPDFELGAVRVRAARRQLVATDGAVREVEPRVLQVLVALAAASPEVVSRDALIEACWGGRIVGDDAINRCIVALRHLARSFDPPPFAIETFARIGYSLVAPAKDAAAAPELKPPTPKSVAVLPFANLTGDPAKDYLADGMAEELITTLSRGSDLKVPARTSTFSYKGRDADVRDIARELGVTAVLEGSIRAAGARIRVTAQLIDADSGFHLWSQNYDRDMRDLLAVQDELAGSIARALEAKLGAGPARPVDPQAFELNLQARGMASRATPDGFLRAIALHEQAIERDPGFARAYGDLAGSIVISIIFGVLPLDRRVEARVRAEQAIRLDPGYPAGPAILATLDSAKGRWLEAERGFRVAIELDPEDPVIIEALALHLLVCCGRIRQSLALTSKAVQLAPASPNQHLHCAIVASMCGDEATRDAHLDAAILLGIPETRETLRMLRSGIAFQDGRYDDAAGEMSGLFQLLACLMGAGHIDVVGPVYAALAGRADARAASQVIREFLLATDREEALWRFPTIGGLLLQWQVLLGAIDEAFELADRLVASWRRSGHLAYTILPFFWRQQMQPFRRDARFQNLVEQLGMIPFWERHGPPDGYELRDRLLIEARSEESGAPGQVLPASAPIQSTRNVGSSGAAGI